MGSTDSATDLTSFKNLWSAFVRSTRKLMDRSHVRPEDETAFMETKRHVVERWQRLSSDIDIPRALSQKILSLRSVEGISSLSDAELDEMQRTIRDADKELGEWMDKANRKDIYREGLEKKANRERIKMFVVIPVDFAVLVALFVFLGLTFFLNR